MNQSDMRGLILTGSEPTGLFSVVSRAFYGREFSRQRIGLSQRGNAHGWDRARPRWRSRRFQLSKSHPSPSNLAPRRRGMKRENRFHSIGRGVWRSRCSRSIAHRKPASSRVTATTTLHGGLPRLTRCQYRFRSRCPARSARSIAHCG